MARRRRRENPTPRDRRRASARAPRRHLTPAETHPIENRDSRATRRSNLNVLRAVCVRAAKARDRAAKRVGVQTPPLPIAAALSRARDPQLAPGLLGRPYVDGDREGPRLLLRAKPRRTWKPLPPLAK